MPNQTERQTASIFVEILDFLKILGTSCRKESKQVEAKKEKD